MNNDMPLQGGLEIVPMAMITVALVLAFVRILRGPTLPDRVIALDLTTILGLGMLSLYAIAADQPVYLDIGIVLTLVTFLATISFAYFLEKGSTEGGSE